MRAVRPLAAAAHSAKPTCAKSACTQSAAGVQPVVCGHNVNFTAVNGERGAAFNAFLAFGNVYHAAVNHHVLFRLNSVAYGRNIQRAAAHFKGVVHVNSVCYVCRDIEHAVFNGDVVVRGNAVFVISHNGETAVSLNFQIVVGKNGCFGVCVAVVRTVFYNVFGVFRYGN